MAPYSASALAYKSTPAYQLAYPTAPAAYPAPEAYPVPTYSPPAYKPAAYKTYYFDHLFISSIRPLIGPTVSF